MKEQPSNQPYKVTYSNVILGDQVYSQKLLWLCKYWQDNDIDKIADMLDDNFVGYMPNGTLMKDNPDGVNAFREMRDAMGSIDLTLNACTFLKSPDVPDRQAVSIWFDETDTAKEERRPFCEWRSCNISIWRDLQRKGNAYAGEDNNTGICLPPSLVK